ncbi:MAG: rhomboid family intramembrane serine protease [Chloroflexi bacterium]|nr:MAG: rhomboid family intramembrane serine protease [Chloroflexota bacterium]
MALFFGFLIAIIITLIATSIVTPLPLTDTGTVRYRTVPWVTLGLIVVNSLIFIFWQAADLYQAQDIQELEPYIRKIWMYGYRETAIREGAGIGAFTAFTSTFMHGDFWHLFFNMIYLWAFGRRVEDSMGAWRYLLFYLFAGMIAGLGSVLLNPSDGNRPSIGASGAISGVMGAYLILFPGARVLCLWGIGAVLRVPYVLFQKAMGSENYADAKLFTRYVQVPAFIVLILFAITNTLPSFDVITQGNDLGGVNTLAHLTGFLAALAVFFFIRKDLLMRYIHGRAV